MCCNSDVRNDSEGWRGSQNHLIPCFKLSRISSCMLKPGFCEIPWYHYKDFSFHLTNSSWFLSHVCKSRLSNATSTSLPSVAQSVFLKSRLSTLTAQTYISTIISIFVWNFYCIEKEPVINTALPTIFTLTDPECSSGEGFLGLLGFRQVKDNWNVV